MEPKILETTTLRLPWVKDQMNAQGIEGVSSVMHRFVLMAVWLGLVAVAASNGKAVTLSAPARWLSHDGSHVFALLESGDLIRTDGSSVVGVAKAWSPDAPIKFAHGRLHGVTAQGELQVLEGGRVRSSTDAKLSLNAGVLPLPAGVIAVAANGDLLRLESSAERWKIVARAKLNVLRDARLSLVDLEGNADGAVAALVNPSIDRYRHAVLGDATEATSVVVLERHSLEVIHRYDLPAPYVFEDMTLRPVNIAAKDQLAVVRSGPNGGAALALIGLNAGKLELNVGPDFGQPNRWLNPLVGFGALYAIHTPHIGGVLTRYALGDGKLKASKQLEGLSSHRIGSRNLEGGAVIAPGVLIVPSQNHRQLQKIVCSSRCQIKSTYDLGAEYSSNLIVTNGAVVIASEDGKLHFWNL
jgi:hypothetical protein